MSDQGDRKRSLFSRITGPVIAVAILVVGFLGYQALTAFRQPPQQAAPQSRAELVETVPLRIASGPVEIGGSGFVTAARETALAARVAGAVVMVSPQLEAGRAVSAGDMLIELDRRPFESALAQARADRASTASELAFANRQIERTSTLERRGFAAEQRLDELTSQRDQARARLARLDAQIVQRELDLEFATITAPYDGRIISEAVAVGAVVQPGQELARIYANDRLEIVLPLESRDAALIPGLWQADAQPTQSTDGPPAHVDVRFGRGTYRWAGRVARVEADIDRQTRTVDVVVEVGEPETPGTLQPGLTQPQGEEPPALRPGMFAAVTIEGAVVPGRAVIPRNALRRGNTVWVVDADSLLRILPVEIIAERAGEVSIAAAGLADGTPVVVSTLVVASDGMPVRQIADETAGEAATETPGEDIAQADAGAR